jgi:hypothetical protein
MDQPPPAEEPSRLIRLVDRVRRQPPERRRAVALLWAAFATAAIVGGLLALQVRSGSRDAARPATGAAGDFPL